MRQQNKALEHLQSIKIRDEYGTPKKLFEIACNEHDIHPTIDICASDANHVLDNYITKKDDCFKQIITEPFFMNPPYSKVSEFMKFAYDLHVKRNLDALILVYAKTGVGWWHDHVVGKAEIHYVKGRIKFLDENGKIPTWCKTCKRKYSGVKTCPNIHCVCKDCEIKYPKKYTSDKICPKCHKLTIELYEKTTENTAPYDSCWIIYRTKK